MIIGTAGHIDHGKSALVTALTGRAVDRLAEEKRRGITIDLNFAPLEFPDLPPAGIVDVPGHEDFVRTMVAGATGIDLVLLVVDLAEGPRPQTEEHLLIVEQLRVPAGIPVFTKADLVDSEWAELVVADFADRLARSPVRFGPPAIVSAVTGQGIPELKARLRDAIERHRRAAPPDVFRMPIDRAFSVAGTGTVVTGTTWSGSLRPGDSVRILPAGHTARVRSVESYGQTRKTAAPGNRTALGLVGVEREAIGRGDVAVAVEAPWPPSTALDVEIEPVAGRPRLAARARVRLLLGTAEVMARVSPHPGTGDRQLARLVLEAPVVARGGDRFVLRSYSPVTTIGGGRVLDPWPVKRSTWPPNLAALDDPARAAALVERQPRGIPRAALPLALGIPAAAAADAARRAGLEAVGDRWVPPGFLTGIEARLLSAVTAFHRASPEEPGMSRETLRRSLGPDEAFADPALDRLVAARTIATHESVVALTGFRRTIVGGDRAVDQLIELLEQRGFEPPDTAELSQELGRSSIGTLLKVAVERNAIAPVEQDRYYGRMALDRFVAVLEAIGRAGDITPGAVREVTKTSRKFLIPLLEWADRQGVTRRDGEVRKLVRNGRSGAS